MVDTLKMFKEINKLIDNHLIDSSLDNFSVIIGSNPSKGARSPILWNKVYKEEKKNVAMLPLDVNSDGLLELILLLQEHRNCLGGAIAVPHKEAMFKILQDECAPEIKEIGAINCFFRNTKTSLKHFSGTNTDGEASLDPIQKLINEENKFNIALIGFGGTGKAIAAFLIKHLKRSHDLKIFNRTKIKRPKTKFNVSFLDLKVIRNYIDSFDLIINATTLGTKYSPTESPIPPGLFGKIKKDAIIYDINYDPPKTKFIKLAEEKNLRAINGLRMNLIQAVLAYRYTNETSLTQNKIYEIMNS